MGLKIGVGESSTFILGIFVDKHLDFPDEDGILHVCYLRRTNEFVMV